MPTISSRLTDPPVLASGTPGVSVGSISAEPPAPSPGLTQPAPVLSSILRCPLPTLGTASTPDGLRQYYAGGTIPQYRLNPPAALSNANTGITTGPQGASGPTGPRGAPGPTIGSGVPGFIPVWTTTLQQSDSHMDDGVTTSGTITSSEPLTVSGDITAQAAGFKVSSNVVIPSTSTGYHGGAGDVKVQMSDGTGVSGHLASFDSAGGLTDGGSPPTPFVPIANIQITTGTTAIPALSCTLNTATPMTGLLTTSVIISPTPTTDTSAITGWGAVGGLSFSYYVTAGTFNWSVCNTTSASITPGGSIVWNVGAM